jgi:amidase
MTSTGLPIGLQAIGPYLEDRTPIRFASLITREMGGFHRPPEYDKYWLEKRRGNNKKK